MTALTYPITSGMGFSTFIRNHLLIVYFFMAFAGMWIVILPLVMDSFGWLDLSDGLSRLLFIQRSLSGPALAVFWVTNNLEGWSGMALPFHRTFQVGAGLRWYAVALFIFLARLSLC